MAWYMPKVPICMHARGSCGGGFACCWFTYFFGGEGGGGDGRERSKGRRLAEEKGKKKVG